jgi:hypothetical protein
MHPEPIHNSLPSSNAQVPGCLSILFVKVEGVVYWSTAKKMPRKVPKENKLNVISNKAITNTWALLIDKMLYIYVLCPHSEHQNNPFQSKQFKHFHQRNQLT